MRMAPCKDCEDRYPACHDLCSQYRRWVAERDEIKQKRKENAKEHDYFVAASMRHMRKK